MRLVACSVVFLALAGVASAATTTHTNACLKRHHVVTAARPLREVTRFGVRVFRYEGFSFRGTPPQVYDNGALIFERSHAIAVQVKRTLFDRLAAFQIANSQDSPYHIRLALQQRLAIVRNVVVVWNTNPQTPVAKTILYGCLR